MNRQIAAEALRTTSAADLAVRRAELQASAEATGMGPEDIEEVLNSRPDLPRELLAEERGALMTILSHVVDSDVRDKLLVQARSARVVGYCGCGCASVDLHVDRTAPPARGTTSPLPVHTVVRDAAGDEVGGVILFLTGDGFMSLLEVYSWDEPISPFPPSERLECF